MYVTSTFLTLTPCVKNFKYHPSSPWPSLSLPPPTGVEGDPEKLQELYDELMTEQEERAEEEEQEEGYEE